MRSTIISRTVPCAALFLLLALPALAQDTSRRLILKDGSYQVITRYEVKGDRVRYYSTEREEWEELPNSLVDWPATEKYEKDRAANAASPEAAALDKELQRESELEEARLPQVAPGLRLPEDSGVFLLDNFRGEPQIDEINQTAGDVNRNTKGNIFRGAINPIAGIKQTIELDGTHASVQSHVDIPSLYINVDEKQSTPFESGLQPDSVRGAQPQQPQQAQQPIVPFDRFRILRMEIKGNKRIVGDVKRQVTGKISHEQHQVKATITDIRGGWLKVTPTESLSPGEYALVEMTEKEGMNLYVWDFGVNPKAPANANPWKPDVKLATPPPPKSEK
ncbi:MAG TPA: hypothetical protein VE377_07285 [Candidatus Dormibacteraeota bacterium]|nr:hypothetical protein [Candidatus Dormibacteraeota bacterium]